MADNELQQKVKPYLNQLLEYDKQIAEINISRQAVINNLLDLVCPFKVGDVTVCVGMTHAGKIMRVDELKMKQNQKGNYYWQVSGTILKKDGTDTERVADFTEMDYNFEKEFREKVRPDFPQRSCLSASS